MGGVRLGIDLVGFANVDLFEKGVYEVRVRARTQARATLAVPHLVRDRTSHRGGGGGSGSSSSSGGEGVEAGGGGAGGDDGGGVFSSHMLAPLDIGGTGDDDPCPPQQQGMPSGSTSASASASSRSSSRGHAAAAAAVARAARLPAMDVAAAVGADGDPSVFHSSLMWVQYQCESYALRDRACFAFVQIPTDGNAPGATDSADGNGARLGSEEAVVLEFHLFFSVRRGLFWRLPLSYPPWRLPLCFTLSLTLSLATLPAFRSLRLM